MREKLFQVRMMGCVGMAVLVMLAGIVLLCPLETPASAASAVTLTGETWTPTMSPPARLIGPEFLKGLEKATGGMVKTDWHTASALGAVPELYTRLVQGIIDWGQFNAGYTPGVFPFTEMIELPIRYPSAVVPTQAMLELYKEGFYNKEYGDIKLLFLYSIGPYQLWSNTKITGVEDLVGKKLRCPSPSYVEATKALGAVPVSMPGGDIYTAMQKGIIDATWACGDMAVAFKIGEIAKYVIMTNIGTATQTFGMNKNTYKALPEAGKKYIADNLEKLSLFGARTFDEYNEKGFAYARKHKVETITWSGAEFKKMDAMLAPIYKTWETQLEAKGLPAKKGLTALYNALEKLGIEEPFVLPR
jgi:TRAP-type C4-dicarboxylate transport system substrate-binding protein